MLCSLSIGLGLVALAYWLLKSDPPPLCGVYAQPGKWFGLKFGLFYALYALRQSRRRVAKEGESGGYGVVAKKDWTEMEKVQRLPPPSDHPLAVDAVYFNGANERGDYFMCSTARRQGGLVQTALFVKTRELGLLQLPSAPLSHHQSSSKEAFAAAGLSITPITPMEKWRIRYEGKLLAVETGKAAEAELDIEWLQSSAHFDFDADMSPAGLAKAIAREPWSRSFFERLRASHQTHYEQCGRMSGRVKVEGVEVELSGLAGVRDHSWGNVRDWSYFHRYALHFFALEDGTRGQVGVVSMPATMSRLEFGYLFTPEGEKLVVDGVDLELHRLGEAGPQSAPKAYEFGFHSGRRQWRMRVEIQERPEFFLGSSCEVRILEQMATFSVDGIRGQGFAEWCYRNHRPREQ